MNYEKQALIAQGELEPTPEALQVDGAQEVVAMVKSLVTAENPGSSVSEVCDRVDIEVAGLVRDANQAGVERGDVIAADLAGIVEETAHPGGETARALDSSIVLPEAFGTALKGGIDEGALSKVAQAIEASHGTTDGVEVGPDYTPVHLTGDVEYVLSDVVDITSQSREDMQLSVEHAVEHQKIVSVSNEEIIDKLKGWEGDAYAQLGAVAGIIKEQVGEQKHFNEEGLKSLMNAIPRELITVALSGESAADFYNLIQRVSETEINSESFESHMKALAMLERTEQSSALGWRKKVCAGEDVSDAARNYIDKPYLASVVLINKAHETGEKMKTKIFAKERQAAINEYRLTAANAVKYVLDTEQYPETQPIAEGMLHGDIGDFGFDEDDGAPKPVGHKHILNFVASIDYLGKSSVIRMHEKLGTVNFGAYSDETLKDMDDILDNPKKYQGIRVLVRGKDGDYNNAFGSLTQRNHRRLLTFEVGKLDDLVKAGSTLRELNIPVERLTFAGHGGEEGIYLSKDALLARQESSLRAPEIAQLIDLVQPDETGQKNISLDSCSQGRKYDNKGSMARLMSDAYRATVTAAPRVSFAAPHSKNQWEFIVKTNRYYEAAQYLEQHPRIPLSGRIASFLKDNPRLYKTGVVRVSNGKAVKDKSGSMKI